MSSSAFRLQQLLSLKGQAPTNVALKCLDEGRLNALEPSVQDQFVNCLEIDSGHPVGCRATRATDYNTFSSFFRAVIESYHSMKFAYCQVEHDFKTPGALLEEKFRGDESMPVRLRAWRNLSKYPFACVATNEENLQIEELMNVVFGKLVEHPLFGGKYVSYTRSHVNRVDEKQMSVLLKDAAFTDERRSAQQGSGCYMSSDMQCVVWLNRSERDDHLVIDVFSSFNQLLSSSSSSSLLPASVFDICSSLSSSLSSLSASSAASNLTATTATTTTLATNNADAHKPSADANTSSSSPLPAVTMPPLTRLQLLLSLLEEHVSFAHSAEFGYLSVNPVQSGVAFSASSRISLPNLCSASANPGLEEVCNHLNLMPRVLSPTKGQVEIVCSPFRHSQAKIMKTLCVGMNKLCLAEELASPASSAVLQENALDREIKKALNGEQMWGPMTQLLDWLYLGSRFNAANERRLASANIVQIVNVAKDCPNWFAGQGTSALRLQYHNVAIEDRATENILLHVDAVVELLESCRKAGKNVLIHCNCGVSRSAAFVVAYLLKYKHRNKDDSLVVELNKPTVRQTLEWVRSKRSMACPNQGFVEQLMKFNKESAYGEVISQPKSKCSIS